MVHNSGFFPPSLGLESKKNTDFIFKHPWRKFGIVFPQRKQTHELVGLFCSQLRCLWLENGTF